MKPKVLVISREAWNDSNNSGNTFSNLFRNWPSDSVASLFCRDEIPQNTVCNRYFRISERLLLKRITGQSKTSGIEFYQNFKDSSSKDQQTIIHRAQEEKRVYDFFRKYRWFIFLWLRELLWSIGLWKSKALKNYLAAFKPDIIFSMSYDSFYMHDLLKYTQRQTSARVVLFHCDDLVTYRKYSLSPFYWINRFLLRKRMDHSIRSADKNYCIIDAQSNTYKKIYGLDFDLLYKSGTFGIRPSFHSVSSPKKLVYAGNIIYGRIHGLLKIANALKTLTETDGSAKLYIYTANHIPQKYRNQLLSTGVVELMGQVPFDQIPGILRNSDVVIHVESLTRRHKLATFLSFSTKLVDYFEAGRAILAFGWHESASIKYLKENDIAKVAENYDELLLELNALINDDEVLSDYGNRAWEFGKKNHSQSKILRKFEFDLLNLAQLD